MSVGEGGFSGITPCLRRISFLYVKLVVVEIKVAGRKRNHSVSALGSSIGTLTGASIGTAIRTSLHQHWNISSVVSNSTKVERLLAEWEL